MTIITDPDFLDQGREIFISTSLRNFRLVTGPTNSPQQGSPVDQSPESRLDDDGVTGQALYSFFKEEWKNDANLIPHPFPMVAITPEQFEFIEDWEPANNTTRKLIRTAGWREIDELDVLKREEVGVITLGTFEDAANDLAYYNVGNDPTLTTGAIDFTYAGPVNEAVTVYEENVGPDQTNGFTFTASTIVRNDGGSWITDGYRIGSDVTVLGSTGSPTNDGTFDITNVSASTITVSGTPFTAVTSPTDKTVRFARNYRDTLKLFLRIRDADTNGKTYSQATIADAGFTAVDNKVFRFPLGNATDLKITATDADIIASPDPVGYTGMSITYYAAAQTRSGYNALGALSPETDGEHGIIIDGNFGTAEQIYEFVQYQLRQAADINTSFSPPSGVVTGRTADELLRFVGDSLEAGQGIPTNPNGGGSGVAIDNFDSNDTNRLTFYDNAGLARTFPFVAAGTINFNANLQNDSMGQFWMFFTYTRRTNVTDLVLDAASPEDDNTGFITSAGDNLPATVAVSDFINLAGYTGIDADMNGIYQVTALNSPETGSWSVTRVDNRTIRSVGATAINVDENPINSADAIIVNSDSAFSPLPIQGDVTGPSVAFDFDYDGNVQGGRTAATDAAITLRAIGLETGQFIETTGTITRATGLSFSLVSSLERNYSNP